VVKVMLSCCFLITKLAQTRFDISLSSEKKKPSKLGFFFYFEVDLFGFTMSVAESTGNSTARYNI